MRLRDSEERQDRANEVLSHVPSCGSIYRSNLFSHAGISHVSPRSINYKTELVASFANRSKERVRNNFTKRYGL